MNKKTLKALQASIKKWQGYTTAERWPKLGRSTCPLCLLFNKLIGDKSETNCISCPVAKFVNAPACNHTPYTTMVMPAARAYNLPAFREAAKAELAFLQSLLPKDQENA